MSKLWFGFFWGLSTAQPVAAPRGDLEELGLAGLDHPPPASRLPPHPVTRLPRALDGQKFSLFDPKLGVSQEAAPGPRSLHTPIALHPDNTLCLVPRHPQKPHTPCTPTPCVPQHPVYCSPCAPQYIVLPVYSNILYRNRLCTPLAVHPNILCAPVPVYPNTPQSLCTPTYCAPHSPVLLCTAHLGKPCTPLPGHPRFFCIPTPRTPIHHAPCSPCTPILVYPSTPHTLIPVHPRPCAPPHTMHLGSPAPRYTTPTVEAHPHPWVPRYTMHPVIRRTPGPCGGRSAPAPPGGKGDGSGGGGGAAPRSCPTPPVKYRRAGTDPPTD